MWVDSALQPITQSRAVVGPGAPLRRLGGRGEAAPGEAPAPGLLSPPAPEKRHL